MQQHQNVSGVPIGCILYDSIKMLEEIWEKEKEKKE